MLRPASFVLAAFTLLGLTVPARAQSASQAGQTLDPVPVGGALGLAKAKAEAQQAAVAQARAKVGGLASTRRQSQTLVGQEKSAFRKHTQAGAAAYKRYQTAVKAAKPPTAPSPAQLLDTAKTEYDAAVTTGATLQKDASALRDAEALLSRTSSDAQQAASAAKAAADSAKTLATQLQSVATAASSAASAAQQAASQARSQSGFPSASAYESAKAKGDAALAKLDADTAAAKATLAEIHAVLKSQGAKPTAATPKPAH